MEISYETIYDYLHGRKYPDGSTDNQKRAIRNKAKKFSSQDGVLHYKAKNGLRQRITEPAQQQKIIEACHADKVGGHFGRDKTREKIASRSMHSPKCLRTNQKSGICTLIQSCLHTGMQYTFIIYLIKIFC